LNQGFVVTSAFYKSYNEFGCVFLVYEARLVESLKGIVVPKLASFQSESQVSELDVPVYRGEAKEEVPSV